MLDATSLRTHSKEQIIYERLRDAIRSGVLESGQRLMPSEIAAQFDVSMMPVRNALLRLEGERLVSRTPYRDWMVASLSEKELHNLFETRSLLNRHAARVAAERIGPEAVAELREIVRRSEGYMAEGSADDLARSTREFTAVLFRQCENDVLLDLIQALRDRASRYRAIYYGTPGVLEQVVAMHRDILAAVERRDPEAVESLVGTLTAHMARTLLDKAKAPAAG